MNISGKKQKRSVTRGWKKQSPGRHERTIMLKRCGRKCFIGPGLSFPICTKRTCSVNKKGVHSAYQRAKQYKYKKISSRAKKLLE